MDVGKDDMQGVGVTQEDARVKYMIICSSP